MDAQRIEFPGNEGQNLVGILEMPEGWARGWAIFAHCFTCTAANPTAVYVSRALAANGIGVMRFDFTGLGESGGEFGAAGFQRDVADVAAAARAMAARGRPPSLLVGHSLGGAAALQAAAAIDSVRAIATIGTPSDPAHVLGQIGDARDRIEVDGYADVDIGGRRFRFQRRFIEETQHQPWQHRIATLRRAVLVMHSPQDSVVGIEHAANIFEAAMHPKSFISLDKVDHLFSDRRDVEWVANIITHWAARYLNPATTASGLSI